MAMTITTALPKFRWAIFIALALLALVIRLPHLGERPMHTDESINAYLTGQLLAGEPFRYDPQDRHGPVLFLFAAPLAKLSGAENFSELTETELRLAPVIAGAVTVLLLGAGVEMFGFIACVIAALLFAVAPLPVYYNRYFIHETFFAAATLGLILSGWRAMKFNSPVQAALAGLCAALMLASKETAVIHFFALTAAGFSALVFSSPKNSGKKIPPAKIMLAAFAVFIFATLLLFTWFGRNWHALADLAHAVSRFTVRAGGEGHEKPFGYYAVILNANFSSSLVFLLSTLGILLVLKKPAKNFALTSLVVYTLIIFFIYGAIPYKTPWLALNFFLPLALLVGVFIERLWFVTTRCSARTVILIFLAALGIFLARDTAQFVFKIPADEKNPYAYAHTGEDLLRLPARLHELAQQNKIADPRIAVVASDAWPLPWYLRKFSRAGFWQPGQETGDADFFITTTDVEGKLAGQLKNFRPEFFGARPGVLIILWSRADVSP